MSQNTPADKQREADRAVDGKFGEKTQTAPETVLEMSREHANAYYGATKKITLERYALDNAHFLLIVQAVSARIHNTDLGAVAHSITLSDTGTYESGWEAVSIEDINGNTIWERVETGNPTILQSDLSEFIPDLNSLGDLNDYGNEIDGELVLIESDDPWETYASYRLQLAPAGM
jgi:hypothetical protein